MPESVNASHEKAPTTRHPEATIAFAPAEAARQLCMSRATLYARMKDGTIPSVKIGGRRLIRRDVLERLLDGDDPIGGGAS